MTTQEVRGQKHKVCKSAPRPEIFCLYVHRQQLTQNYLEPSAPPATSPMITAPGNGQARDFPMRLINAIAQALECILSTWPKDKNACEGDCARQLRSVLLGLLGKQQVLCSAAGKKVSQWFTLPGGKQIFLLRTYKHPPNVKQMERLV